MRLIVALGARPNLLKIGPVLPELARAGIECDVALVRSPSDQEPGGAHEVVSFFGVELFTPRWVIEVDTGGPRDPAGAAMQAFEDLFSRERPDAAFVVGDSGVALAAAVSAARVAIPVVNLDAGLRCGDLHMPEEMNRVLISRASAIHLTPSVRALENLEDEGVEPERIHFVGSTMAESVSRSIDEITSISAAEQYSLPKEGYVLSSVHRPENLHDKGRLSAILAGLSRTEVPVIMPDSGDMVRAAARHGLEVPPNVVAIEPVTYLMMLALQRDADVVLTDSSGVQVEACTIGTACVTVMECTEQEATIDAGANRLVPASPRVISATLLKTMCDPGTWTVPQRWDRAVSDRVVRALKRGIMPLH